MKKVASILKNFHPRVAYCDELPESNNEKPSLIQQADDNIMKSKEKIKTPIVYENLKNIIQQATVNTYDGLRFQVSKGLNMNTQVSHL
jgi:hypothetical protein